MKMGAEPLPSWPQIARDELSNETLAFPGVLAAHSSTLTRFSQQSDFVTKKLLASLTRSLNKQWAQDLDAPSPSGLKFISAPTSEMRSAAPDTTHTDGGILTLLWCPQLSSQILDPQTKEWRWVEPREGCTLVNVADALQSETGGVLHSCVHRVSQPGDGVEERHFISYYLRPGTA